MGSVRVLTNPKGCMQRLGFLKFLVWKASHSPTNNLKMLGKELITVVTSKINIPLNPRIKEYILEALKSPVYKKLRERVPNESSLDVEIQDYYLSAMEIPSKTGKLVPDDANYYPYLAVNLGFLRKTNYALLVRGYAFLNLITDDEIKAFYSLNDENGDIKNNNPFDLTIPQKILLTYSILDCDWDVIKPLYTKLLNFSETFNIFDAGSLLPEIYNDLAKRYKTDQTQDTNRIYRLLKVAQSIEKNINKKPRSTSRCSLTHNITPRLEPLVDLNLLLKPNCYTHNYIIPDKSREFFMVLADSENVEDFLLKKFFCATSRMLCRNCNHSNKLENVLPLIIKSYNNLKDSLGYAPIKEILLLSGIFNIVENRGYFEIQDGIELIMSLREKYPYEIKFNVDRWGKLTYLKFEKSLLRKIGL